MQARTGGPRWKIAPQPKPPLQPSPPPRTVESYKVPSAAIATPLGSIPSLPREKVYKVFKTQDEPWCVSLKTVPQPP
jgi:hypothetical protein